jgi:hypothetical protein
VLDRREERVANAKVVISNRFNAKQQIFLDFVLSHYVSIGIDEPDQEKLTRRRRGRSWFTGPSGAFSKATWSGR